MLLSHILNPLDSLVQSDYLKTEYLLYGREDDTEDILYAATDNR